MTEENIDDIFAELDLIDGEEAQKNAESLAKFKFDDDVKPSFEKKVPQGRKIDSKYFEDLYVKVKSDPDFLPIQSLLVNNVYDIVDYADINLLREKHELKLNAIRLNNGYKFSQERTYKQFIELIDAHNMLFDNPLFENDYFPYKQLVTIFERNNKAQEGLDVIRDFFNSEMYCDDVIFEFFVYHVGLFSKRLKLEIDNDWTNLINEFDNNRKYYEKPQLPVADRIFKDRSDCFLISEEKHEFNQLLVLLMVKAITYERYYGFSESIEFYVNLADCEILYFKSLAYSSLEFISRRMHSSDAFLRHYLDAIKNKNANGNILQDDFDRIFECKQFEIDMINNDEEMSLEDQFDKLFSGQYRR